MQCKEELIRSTTSIVVLPSLVAAVVCFVDVCVFVSYKALSVERHRSYVDKSDNATKN